MTRTLVAMKVSQTTFDEIAAAFRAVDYRHVFMRDGSLDMSEIGLIRDPERAVPPGFVSVDPTTLPRDEFRRAAGVDLIGSIEPDEASS